MRVVRWLLWDDANIAHIARHQVTPAEVEQVVFEGDPLLEEAKSTVNEQTRRDGDGD